MEIDICYKSGLLGGEPFVKRFLEYHCCCPPSTDGETGTQQLGGVSTIIQLVVKIGSVKTVCEAAGLKSPSFLPSYRPASDVSDLR